MLTPDSSKARGFSLIEMVLIFALIAVATSMTLVSFDMLGASGRSEPPERVAMQAIRQARIAAITEKAWTFLSWNEEARSFEITTQDGGIIQTIPVERMVSASEDNLQVSFESIEPEFEGSPPFDFRQSGSIELDKIAFSPQRVSTPFTIKIIDGDIEFTRSIDPFSSLAIEPEEAR